MNPLKWNQFIALNIIYVNILFGDKMNTLEEIELFAKENYVPIARKQTVKFMLDLIKENNYCSFFEVGTAIGYTSIILAKEFIGMRILTIEHDLNRVKIAKENFKNFEVEDRIELIAGDAINFSTREQFDLIFIDAAKKRNRFFLEKYLENLNPGGTIIVDNMNLEDFWVGANENKKAHYEQVMKEFRDYVKNNPLYESTFYDDIGDGIVVIKIKK